MTLNTGCGIDDEYGRWKNLMVLVEQDAKGGDIFLAVHYLKEAAEIRPDADYTAVIALIAVGIGDWLDEELLKVTSEILKLNELGLTPGTHHGVVHTIDHAFAYRNSLNHRKALQETLQSLEQNENMEELVISMEVCLGI